MTDKTYTLAELNEAAKELDSAQNGYLGKLAGQADKNRIVKTSRLAMDALLAGTGMFTEKQVRRAVAASVHRPGSQEVRTRGVYWSTETFVGDVISRLREPESVPEPVEGGVYRSPGNILYRRSQGRWLMFGLTAKLTDDGLGYPVEKMERVL